MPPEPKRPIEELLEASAQARRADFGADPKMPNPMRSQLHDEILRQGRSEQPPRERRSWLAMFWPQLSFAAAAAAMLLTASVLWIRSQQPQNGGMELAMHTPGSPAADAAAPPRSLATEPQQSVGGLLAQKDEDRTEPAAANEEMPDAVRTFTEGAIAAAPPAASASDVVAQPPTERLDEVAQVPALAARPAGAARSFAQNPAQNTANVQQRFSQQPLAKTGRDDAKAKPRARILNNFDVEQDGERIRVVDEDGSTYTGRLELIAARKKDVAATAPGAAIAGRAPAAESNEFKFRAEGFNGSLKKRVVFEGNYVVSPDPEQARSLQESKREAQAQARVTGTANVAGEPPIQVDAISVSR